MFVSLVRDNDIYPSIDVYNLHYNTILHTIFSIDKMEEDRAEGNLGIAADLPENEEPVVQRVPKKRFIGRRQAAELALNGPATDAAPSIENSIQG